MGLECTALKPLVYSLLKCNVTLFINNKLKQATIYNALILSSALTVFSYEPNAVSLKYPSPLGPKPEPSPSADQLPGTSPQERCILG